MAKKWDAPEFAPEPDDPLESEHRAIQRWVRESVQSPNFSVYRPLDPSSIDSGRVLVEADPGQARLYVLAALALAWRFSGGDDDFRHPDFMQRLHVNALLSVLLRRDLPLQSPDLRALLTWVLCRAPIEFDRCPNALVVKALENWSESNEPDPELLELTQSYASMLRRSNGTQPRRLAAQLDRIVQAGSTLAAPPQRKAPPPKPAPAGNPLVLLALKRALGTAASFETEPETIVTGPDQFAMPVESPLRTEHELISAIFAKAIQGDRYEAPDARRLKAVADMAPAARGRLLLAAAERHYCALAAKIGLSNDARSMARHAADEFASSWPPSQLEFERQDLFDTLTYWSTLSEFRAPGGSAVTSLLRGMELEIESGAGLTEGERYALHLWRASLINAAPLGTGAPGIDALTRWIGDGARFFLVPGERWADAINEDLTNLPPQVGRPWAALVSHLTAATSARPTDKWRKEAKRLIDAIGGAAVRQALERWLPLISKGRSLLTFPAYAGDTRRGGDFIHESNATILRGLLWIAPMLDGRDGLIRLITSVALSAYRKIPGVGPRAVKVGNAAVFALSEIGTPEATAQLAMIKVRVRFGTAQKEVEKAFDAAARALDLPRDEIEELNVPVCGLESVGRREETIGEYRAELTVTGSEASLNWYDARGKRLASAPAAVKRGDNAEAWKELRTAQDDLNAMLGVHRDRIDAMFLERKSWPAAVWRERYLDHPLMGTIARRLIWCAGSHVFTAVNGELLDLRGSAVTIPLDARVSLWHPAERDVSNVLAWRRRIEELEIVQPFKQAHREVYLLTDAERRTNTYSNRFAAHILRQHQFNALCGARRWKNRLRMMVDDTYPPASRDLPAWGLRAEFWIEGAGTEYGTDTNDAGAFLRLASDQVRFYRTGAAANLAHAGGGGYSTAAAGPGTGDINEPLALSTIPVLVFSEIMRDVDLFVGVSSVGNDPAWQDGGPGGRYLDYWNSYSFGELGATAISRREALERLLPRLKIASVCTLDGRFLTVRGKKRSYKIHLGSGNILMEPNDQYLCIVPDSRSGKETTGLYLPFEGDRTLSIIISKAFLLAADDEIKDPAIISQIG